MPQAGPTIAEDEFQAIQGGGPWRGRQRVVLALARNLAPLFIRGLGRTLRFELPQGVPPGAFTEPPETAIYVFWHRCLLPIAWIARGRGFGVLVSHHFDGELISQAAQRLGYRLFRGSSTRGGSTALQDMREALDRGVPIALTVDGPRGPKFRAKGGAIQLARLTGAPIYGLHASPRSFWQTSSWDRFQVPKPFSRVRGAWRGPLTVAPDASNEQMEIKRLEMEAMLNRLREENDVEESR